MAHRGRHVCDHARIQRRDHRLAITQQLQTPLPPYDDALTLANDKIDGVEEIHREAEEAEIGLLSRMRKTLRRLEKCQLVASVPPKREASGPVAGGLLGSIRLGPHRRLEGCGRDHRDRVRHAPCDARRALRDDGRAAQGDGATDEALCHATNATQRRVVVECSFHDVSECNCHGEHPSIRSPFSGGAYSLTRSLAVQRRAAGSPVFQSPDPDRSQLRCRARQFCVVSRFAQVPVMFVSVSAVRVGCAGVARR